MSAPKRIQLGGLTIITFLILALMATVAETPAASQANENLPAKGPAGDIQAADVQARNTATDMVVMAYDWDDSDRALGYRFLTVTEADGKNVRFLATGGSVQGFDVDRKGKKIVYVTGDALWSIGINGKNDKKLLQMPEGTTITTPTWSKNGKEVWFGTYGGVAGVRVHKYNIKKKKLTTDSIKNDLAVQLMRTFHMSPNGKWLLMVPTEQYQKDRGFPPLIYNIKNGSVIELPEPRIEDAGWTPDNNIIAYDIFGGFEHFDISTKKVITIFDPTGIDFISSMDVSPDGSKIFYQITPFQNFVVVDVASGTRRGTTLFDTDGFENKDYGGGGQIEWIKSKTNPDPSRCYGWVVTKRSGDRSTTIRGTEGGDVIQSGGGDDIIYALGGNDVVCGGDVGDDVIYGGHGDDFLNGDEGNDRIYGGPGNDIIWGDAGSDRLYGQGGDDTLFSDGDDSVIDGGPGADECYGDGC